MSWDRGQRSSDLLGNRNSVRRDGAESYVDDCGLAIAWGKVDKAGLSPSGTKPFWIWTGEGVLAYLWTPERPVRSPVFFFFFFFLRPFPAEAGEQRRPICWAKHNDPAHLIMKSLAAHQSLSFLLNSWVSPRSTDPAPAPHTFTFPKH